MDEEEILNDLLSWSSVSPHAAFPGPDVVPGPVPGTQTLPHIFSRTPLENLSQMLLQCAGYSHSCIRTAI